MAKHRRPTLTGSVLFILLIMTAATALLWWLAAF